MGVMKDATAQMVKIEQDGPAALHQGAGKGMGPGAGKRVMGGGGPMSQTAQQAELKLEQIVDQRDMAIANASVNGDAGIETITNQEILPISEVKLPLEIGTRVDCRWRDGEYHPARVIEKRPVEGTDQHEYYMHYSKYHSLMMVAVNRRMDEWVKQENLNLNTVDVGDVDGSDPKSKKRRLDDVDDEHHGEFDANELRQHEEFTKVKNVDSVELGQYQMETWYFSPLPAEYNNCKTLFFAEYDLAFFKTRPEMMRHLRKCKLQHPPGDEIYRRHYAGGRSVSMFEVDGKKEKLYCQNLCYLAKLFLDHKTLYYDVDLFLFYVLCENDERGSHIVGYFSKEKCSEEGYNLACILTLPSHQRKGYGKFLIAMSYELSKVEGKVGTPERPLSDLGNVSYRGYWTRELLKVLKEQEGSISIKDLSTATMIKTDDIISTLNHLNLIQYQKGQHVICAAPAVIEKHIKEAGSPGLQVDPKFIVWCPYSAEREYAMYRS